MPAISSRGPFRDNILSRSATGATVNPPPSFHSIARDNETTINPIFENMLLDLPWIPEAERERDLPSIPTLERAAAIHERDLPPLLARGIRGPSDPNIILDSRLPRILEEPPAYTARPEGTHGERAFEPGSTRPFQREQVANDPGSGLSLPLAGLRTVRHSPRDPPPTSADNSLPHPLHEGNQRSGIIQLVTDTLGPRFERFAMGIGNLLIPHVSQNPDSSPVHQTRPSHSTSDSTSVSSPHHSPPTPQMATTMRSIVSAPLPGSDFSCNFSTLGEAEEGWLNPDADLFLSSDHTSSNVNQIPTSPLLSDFARDFYAVGGGDGSLNRNSESLPHHNYFLEGLRDSNSPALSVPSTHQHSPSSNYRPATPSIIQPSRSNSTTPDPTQVRLCPNPIPVMAAASDFARDFYAIGEAQGLLNLDSDSNPDLYHITDEPPVAVDVSESAAQDSMPPMQPNRSFYGVGSSPTPLMAATTTVRENSDVMSEFTRDFYAVREVDGLLNLNSQSFHGYPYTADEL